MKALEIKGLKKSFRSNFLFKKSNILKGIDLDVEKGEIYGFLGPNGSGKTTTIKCVMGLLAPDAGEMRVNGQSATLIEARRRIGFLPENPHFYDYLTAREFLLFSASLFNIPEGEAGDKVAALIHRVGLSGQEDLKLRKFSKGMIQRLGLAQALVNDPDLLILDEPFSGLDPIGRKDLRLLILAFREQGKTVFFSSHILQDMELMVNRVGIIVDGAIRRQGRLWDWSPAARSTSTSSATASTRMSWPASMPTSPAAITSSSSPWPAKPTSTWWWNRSFTTVVASWPSTRSK